MRFLSNLFPRRKRVTRLAGLAALALVLAGCSPGDVESFWSTFYNGSPFLGTINMNCEAAPSNSRGNCTGQIMAKVGGSDFVAGIGTGGTYTPTSFFGNPAASPATIQNFPSTNVVSQGTCTSAPCPEDAGIFVSGAGSLGGMPAKYWLIAEDPDDAATDHGMLTINGISYQFSCRKCVEITMQPGSTPSPLD